MTIVPVYPDADASPQCHWTCEWAVFSSECDCKSCNGANHGRSKEHSAFWGQNNRKQFYSAGKIIDWWSNGDLCWFAESAC